MKKDIYMFEDSEKVKVGLEKTRKKILGLLKVDNMTISQIAEALDKDRSTIYRHIKKLENAGFVEVKDERKEYHIPEKIYGRTAEVFLMAPEPIDNDKPSGLGLVWKDKRMERCLQILNRAGLKCNDKEAYHKLTELLGKVDEEMIEKMDRPISESEDMNFFTLIQAKFLADIITIMNQKELKEEFESIVSKFDESLD